MALVEELEVKLRHVMMVCLFGHDLVSSRHLVVRRPSASSSQDKWVGLVVRQQLQPYHSLATEGKGNIRAKLTSSDPHHFTLANRGKGCVDLFDALRAYFLLYRARMRQATKLPLSLSAFSSWRWVRVEYMHPSRLNSVNRHP